MRAFLLDMPCIYVNLPVILAQYCAAMALSCADEGGSACVYRGAVSRQVNVAEERR